MKKVIIVLLITVLVAGFAFAGDFTGYARIEFGVDLDENEWGFKNITWGKYTFKFAVDTAAVKIGENHETDLWAELEANAEAYIQLTAGAAGNLANAATAVNPGAVYTAKITKANIHVGEITFGILNAGTAADFAKTYYKVGNAQFSAVRPLGTAPGFTVEYKDWKGGFGANGDWNEEDNADDNEYHIFAHVETPTFKFADEQVTVNAGAYAYVTDKNSAVLVGANPTNFGAAAKATYAADKLSADLEADLRFKSIPEQDGEFDFEVAANATYDFVTLNVYLASGRVWEYADDDPLKLDAKLSAKYTFDFNEDIALDVEGWVDARNTLVEALSLEIGAIEGTTIDAFTIELTEVATLENLANDADVEVGLDVEAYVAYEHEKFTAYADVMTAFLFDKDDDTDLVGGIFFEAGISSDAIIEGATLALVYGDNSLEGSYVDFLDFENHKGAVTASCTISF